MIYTLLKFATFIFECPTISVSPCTVIKKVIQTRLRLNCFNCWERNFEISENVPHFEVCNLGKSSKWNLESRNLMFLHQRVLHPIFHEGGIMAWKTEDCLPFPCGLRYAHRISWLCFFYHFTSLRRVTFIKIFFCKSKYQLKE